mmetsp:Transcript_7640/g.25129  ORF Transcript_7640/g.25129 Transcript_7640/m.25129 type:complete len:145 (-) Transcript_7640:456-890(-)
MKHAKQVQAQRDRQVSLSALAFLFSELVQYQTIKICSASDLECGLEQIGRSVGTRVIELLSYRDRQIRRELSLIGILQFISTTCWKALFGKPADSLERSTENDNECASLLFRHASDNQRMNRYGSRFSGIDEPICFCSESSGPT